MLACVSACFPVQACVWPLECRIWHDKLSHNDKTAPRRRLMCGQSKRGYNEQMLPWLSRKRPLSPQKINKTSLIVMHVAVKFVYWKTTGLHLKVQCGWWEITDFCIKIKKKRAAAGRKSRFIFNSVLYKLSPTQILNQIQFYESNFLLKSDFWTKCKKVRVSLFHQTQHPVLIRGRSLPLLLFLFHLSDSVC